MKKVILLLILALIIVGVTNSYQAQEQKVIHVLELKGDINKATETIIINAIEKANNENGYAFILALNTPGGRTDSMFNIVESIQASSIPVLYFVYPKGAISASAGTYIAMASHIVGMAPLTTIGACEPILGYDPTTGDIIETPQKIREYYTAVMRSYAEDHDRDPEIAAKFVSENLSLTPNESIDLGMADVNASTIEEFVALLDGVEIKGSVNGEKPVLDTKDATFSYITLSLRDKIMKAISDPNIAYLLTTIGVLGIVFGFLTPGIGVPEVVGVVCLSLAVIANGYVGFEFGGIILVVLGVIFFIIEASTPTFGLYSAAGIVSFVMGSLLLFSGTTGGEGRFFDEGSIKTFWTSIAVMTLVVAGFLVFGLQAALKLKKKSPTTGQEQMLNECGIVIDEINPIGTVKIHGELWNARSNERILEGEEVRVIAIKGLIINVEKIKEEGGETKIG